MNKENGMLPLKKRFYFVLALAVVAVLGSTLTVRHMSNRLTRGLTELVPSRAATAVREEVRNVPDTRETPPTETATAATSAAATKAPAATRPATTRTPTTTAAPTAAAAAAETQRETFRLPLNGTKIQKDYSPTIPVKSTTMGDWRTHNGIDFAAKEGDKVYAVGSGVVTKVTSDEGWGYVIEVDHGSFTARYCALQQDGAVSIGKTLKKGDVIGTVAVSPLEQADGCHLHFECLRSGALTDPMEVLQPEER